MLPAAWNLRGVCGGFAVEGWHRQVPQSNKRTMQHRVRQILDGSPAGIAPPMVGIGALQRKRPPGGGLAAAMVEVAGIEPASNNLPLFDLHA